MPSITAPISLLPLSYGWMFVIGIAQFLLCFAIAYIGFRTIANFDHQPKFVKTLFIIFVIAWLSLIVVGFFAIPNEAAGSYLDVYANLALANIGFMMVIALICVAFVGRSWLIFIGFTLFFGGVFGAIGGKGIGDALSPNRVKAKIHWLSFDDTDKNLSSLRVGTQDFDVQQTPSDHLTDWLANQGHLQDVEFSDGDAIKPPI